MSVIKKISILIMLVLCIITNITISSACTACTSEISYRIKKPYSNVIKVDEEFTIEVVATTCGNRKKVNQIISFESEDQEIASVGSKSGTVVGRGVGVTEIIIKDEMIGIIGQVEVQVVE